MKETEEKDIGDDGRKSTQFRLASMHDTSRDFTVTFKTPLGQERRGLGVVLPDWASFSIKSSEEPARLLQFSMLKKKKRGGGGRKKDWLYNLERKAQYLALTDSVSHMQFLCIPDHLDTVFLLETLVRVLQQQQRRELGLTAQTEHRLSDYDIHIWTTAIGQLAVGLETEKNSSHIGRNRISVSADRSTTAGHSRTTK